MYLAGFLGFPGQLQILPEKRASSPVRPLSEAAESAEPVHDTLFAKYKGQ